MEATKKKKAYLKPEMNRFEMKTEGFMVGSKVEVDVTVPEEEKIIQGLLSSQCTDNGSAFNQLVPGGDCQTFGAMKIDNNSACGLWKLMLDAGLNLNEKDRVIVCRLENDANGNRVYRGKLVQ